MIRKLLISALVIICLMPGLVLGSCNSSDLKVSDLSINPENAIAGETVTVRFYATNNSGAEGTFDLSLLVNGVVDSHQEMTLPVDATRIVTFELCRDTPGTYQIEVAGLKGELEVLDLGYILEQSRQAMSAVNSYHFKCTMEIGMSVME